MYTDMFICVVSSQRSQFLRATLTLFCRFLNGLIMANQNVHAEHKSQENCRRAKRAR